MQTHVFNCVLEPHRKRDVGGRISRRRGCRSLLAIRGNSNNGMVEGSGYMSARNIVECRWFTGKGSVGVILIKTEYSGYKAYIGAALDVNEEYDAAFIVAWGTKLPRSIAAAYFPKKLKDGVMYDGKTDTRPKSRKNIG